MPCDSVRLTSVDLSIATHPNNIGMLTKALQDLGYTVNVDGTTVTTERFTIRDGKLIGYNVDENLSATIKRAYVSRVVKVAASKYGAKVKQVDATHLRVTL